MPRDEQPRILTTTLDLAPLTEPAAPGAAVWSADASPARLTAGLAEALLRRGQPLRVALPFWPGLEGRVDGLEQWPAPPFSVRFGRELHDVSAWNATVASSGLRLLLLRQDELFSAGTGADSSSGTPLPRSWQAAFFARALLQAFRLQGEARPSVLHCQGEATAILPTLLRLHHAEEQPYSGLRAVLALHGGVDEAAGDDPQLLPRVGLSPDRFYATGPFEHRGRLSMTKAGMLHADALTGVSAGHARRVEASDLFASLTRLNGGGGLTVRGTRVGIDTVSWDPSRDPRLPENFSAESPRGRSRCREGLAAELGLTAAARPAEGILLAHVGELGGGAGTPVVLEAAPRLLAAGASLVVVGTGDAEVVDACVALAAEHPGRVASVVTRDEGLARRILAAADACLLPSTDELTAVAALKALRYGCVPILGPAPGFEGLVADVDDGGAAWCLPEGTAEALAAAVRRATALRHEPAAWDAVVARAMSVDASWEEPARWHEELFGELVDG